MGSPQPKGRAFYSAAKLTTIFSLEDVLASQHRENKADIWTASLPHVCDFLCVRGRGIKFHCNDRDIAIKLGGSTIRCLGKQLQIQPYRQYVNGTMSTFATSSLVLVTLTFSTTSRLSTCNSVLHHTYTKDPFNPVTVLYDFVPNNRPKPSFPEPINFQNQSTSSRTLFSRS